jgi:hypothetical protein
MTENVLEEANRIVASDRGPDYGHPFDDFSRAAKIWSAVLDIEVTPEQVGLCQIGTKIAREVYKPKRDNKTDIAGYARCLELIAERRGARAPNLARKGTFSKEEVRRQAPFNVVEHEAWWDAVLADPQEDEAESPIRPDRHVDSSGILWGLEESGYWFKLSERELWPPRVGYCSLAALVEARG